MRLDLPFKPSFVLPILFPTLTVCVPRRRSVRPVRASQDVSSQRRSVDAEHLSNHVIVAVQGQLQMFDRIRDVKVVGQVEGPWHLVGPAKDEEVTSELAMMLSVLIIIFISVAFTHLQGTKQEGSHVCHLHTSTWDQTGGLTSLLPRHTCMGPNRRDHISVTFTHLYGTKQEGSHLCHLHTAAWDQTRRNI